MPHYLLRHRDIPDLDRLDVYLQHDGYATFERVITSLTPQQVIAEITASGLRGRGGAAFPVGRKWSFLPPNTFPRYLIANADESEPGTFKDREIIAGNPHQFLEGIMIAAYAIQANLAFIYMRGEFAELARQMETRLAELRRVGRLGRNLYGTGYDLDIRLHLGAGAYICGEETALIESIEGKRGQPRLRPPFPAVRGLYRSPTVVNNVETLTNIPVIMAHGADWYRRFGTAGSPGIKIYCLSGHIERPGAYELPLGTTLRELIYDHGGGPRGNRPIKGILPAGVSAACLPATPEVLACPLDYESLLQFESGLGSASIIVFDDSVSALWLALKTTRFFHHESCGKCTPCRVGLRALLEILERLDAGAGKPDDLTRLENLGRMIQQTSVCGLGQTAPNVVLSTLRHFRSDYLAHLPRTAEINL